ncbi:MAG: hypothetical protein R2739_09420 [Chitinophagales bacterium]|nr:hypothetical protein [Bacteroidota bacterium]
MHTIEPYWNWRDFYSAENDKNSPFYRREYNEFAYVDKIYNYYIHPQWDFFGSETLYLKLLYANYKNGSAIIELIGEWNDCRANDIETLKHNFINKLIENGIYRFVLIGENLLEFFSGGNEYYEEWHDEIIENGGWIIALNFREHVLDEMRDAQIHYFINIHEKYTVENWRQYKPFHLVQYLEDLLIKVIP